VIPRLIGVTAPPIEPVVPPQRGPRRPTAADVWFAALFTFSFGLIPIAYGGVGGPSEPVLVLATLFGLIQLVALAWRRSHPTHTATVVAAFAVGHYALGQFLQPSDVAVLVALYSVTIYERARSSRVWLLIALTGAAMVGLAYGLSSTGGLGVKIANAAFFAIGCAALALASWAIALVRRARYLEQESLGERAARLERERDQQARLATQAERTRIAREMHDIVAHSLSVVIAQADGGRYASRTDPEAAERALVTISETGRAALADMRRILGVLRDDDGDVAHLVPQPADSDIAALVASMREVLPVSLVEMGAARPMPPGTGTTIYRIAQEALTNILKHGGPSARATMLLMWAPQRVVLQVDDDGRGAAATSDGDGHGLLGMRERATMLGGTLVAGPRAGGGYRVRVEIPIPGGGPSPMPDPPLAPAAPQPPTEPPFPTS